MPELPEVRTVVGTLKNLILNRQITGIDILYPRIVENDISCLIGQRINDISAYGKYIIFQFEKDNMISHLRMEGKYFYEPTHTPYNKHTHVIFHFDNGYDLRYHDTRKFGRMKLVSKEHYFDEEPLCKLGKEPFDFLENEFYQTTSTKAIPIKTLLLDQSLICGLGNIYANEVLFKAGIHPHTKADALSKKQANRIIECSCDILNEAIRQGGTTIRSFSSNGIHGLFSRELMVHEKKICMVCGSEIQREFLNGRSIYYCKNCQKKYYKRKKK